MSSEALKEIASAARPLVEQWLDLSEQFSAFQKTATAKGLDWGRIKALLKAQALDAREEDGSGKRVKQIIDKADSTAAYADMLGMVEPQENNFSKGGTA